MKKQSLKKSANKNKFYRKKVVFEAKKEVNKVKKEVKRKEFPRIYRFITEKWIFLVIIVVFIGAIGLISFDLYKNLQKEHKVDQDRQKLTNEVNYWKNITENYRGYRDGYYKLAVLEYQLKDMKKVKYYLEKTLNLDPSYEPALKLQKLLKGD